MRNQAVLLAPVVLAVAAAIFFYLKQDRAKLVAPVLGGPRLRIADNVWFPKPGVRTSQELDQSLSAKAALFVDSQTGELLYEKNATQQLSPASLVKIMTAIIALENKELTDTLTVSTRAAAIEPDKMQLIAGEKLTVKELLEGVFLISANDAAEVLAEGATGRREEFINLMNAKAVALGMKNSRFVNPTGLEENGSSNYSTAYDIVLMSRYAIRRWPVLLQISSQPDVFIPATPSHQDYTMYSGINLLTTYPGVVGFKTGFTPEAGLNLVTVVRREGKEVLGVLLGTVNRREDARLLLDHCFKKLGIKSPS